MSGLTLYLIVLAIPATLAIFETTPRTHGWIYIGILLSGTVAYTIVTLQFVLRARFENIVRRFGDSHVLRLHKVMAIVATLLVLLHVALLLWSRGTWNLVLHPWVSWPIQFGRLAAVCLLVIVFYSAGRKLLPINDRDWRWFHNVLAWLILIAGGVHTLFMGWGSQAPLSVAIWTIYFLAAVLAWCRLRLDRRKLPEAS